MQVRLTFHNPIGDVVAPPAMCPHGGCGGRRLRLRQTVAKLVRGEQSAPVMARRYTCLDCGRTFRVYPAGIDRGKVPTGIKRFAAALHRLGLGFRDVSRALGVLGIPLGKSQVHAAVSSIVGAAPARVPARLFGPVGFDSDEGAPRAIGRGNPPAWIEISGRKLPLRRVVDAQGRPALVILDVDWWTRAELNRWGRAMLAELGVDVDIVSDTADDPVRTHRQDRDPGSGATDDRVEAAATVEGAVEDGAISPEPDAGVSPPTSTAATRGVNSARWRLPTSRMRPVIHRHLWRTRHRTMRTGWRGRDRIVAGPVRGFAPAGQWDERRCVSLTLACVFEGDAVSRPPAFRASRMSSAHPSTPAGRFFTTG